MSKAQITLGCDPELVLTQNSKIIPACGLIGGTKQQPLRIDGTNTYIQEDGVMVEFNTPTANNVNTFWDIVHQSISDVREFLYSRNSSYSYMTVDSHKYTKEQLASAQAHTLGCDPDLLANLRGAERRPPTIEQLGNVRCAGGHLHVGYPDKGEGSGKIPGWVMVQFIEAGAYFPVMQYDSQPKRREFYGLGGLYREKPYGIEYRTPSTFWLSQHSSSINFLENIHRVARWVCSNHTKAMELWEETDFDSINKSISSGVVNTELMHSTYNMFQKYGVY